MRTLATVRVIDAINPIIGADAIEVATVGGWKVVTRKGEYAVGQLAVYCEIDSWIPHALAPFLSKGKEPRVYNGVTGERLRTIKLRGQLSQGLLLPVSIIGATGRLEIGADVTEQLGVTKWERPIPAQLSGIVRGNFPAFIQKTDQERCQNLEHAIFGTGLKLEYEISVKLDGSSMTVWSNGGDVGVCSRNLDLALDQEGNSFVDLAKQSGLLDVLRGHDGYAVQGEIMGPGIQGNREGLTETQLFVFDIYDIRAGGYLSPASRMAVFGMLQMRTTRINHVPVISCRTLIPATDMDGLLKLADGDSLNNPVREGLVFKHLDGGISFKVISNQYLLGGGD